MLELGDTKRKILRLLTTHEPETPERFLRRIGRERAHPFCFCPPIRDRVTHCCPHLVTIYTDPASEVVREVVGSFHRERRPPEPGEQKLLDRP